jgi:hypothetical protein
MKLGRTVLGAGEHVLDRVLSVLGALVFSQAPEFMQQYLQRLGGHLDEARRQLHQFEQVATQSGITLDRLITQTAASAEPSVSRLGHVMQEAVQRVDTLTAAQAALHDASLWTRPFVFLRYVDLDIARATAAVFRPAVPTTAEGLIYALLGVGVLLALYYLGVKFPIKWALEARARARSAAVRGVGA